MEQSFGILSLYVVCIVIFCGAATGTALIAGGCVDPETVLAYLPTKIFSFLSKSATAGISIGPESLGAVEHYVACAVTQEIASGNYLAARQVCATRNGVVVKNKREANASHLDLKYCDAAGGSLPCSNPAKIGKVSRVAASVGIYLKGIKLILKNVYHRLGHTVTGITICKSGSRTRKRNGCTAASCIHSVGVTYYVWSCSVVVRAGATTIALGYAFRASNELNVSVTVFGATTLLL
jgi:hypothetical protein